jgi:hypothetical protein
MTQSHYINEKGHLSDAVNTLSREREIELRTHLEGCETALQQCLLCMELYSNIGHEAYVEALCEGMEEETDA